jgi:two-component system, chemotaxis family, sensor kinase CheA
MAKNNSSVDRVADLQRLVNDMAMQFVVGGTPSADGRPAWLLSLDEVARYAAELGWNAMVADVNRLREDLIGRDAESAAFADAAQAGVQSLQEALEARQSAVEVRPQPTQSVIAQDPELIADFVVEAREHLQAIEQNLLAVEQNSDSTEPIHAIFRAFHTIKGIAGFLELGDIREVSHETETLLDHARNGDLKLTAQVIDVILAAADYLNREVTRIATGESEPGAPTAQLLADVRAVVAHNFAKEASPDLQALSLAVEAPDLRPAAPESKAEELLAPPVQVIEAPPADAPASEPAHVESKSSPESAVASTPKQVAKGTSWIKVDTTKLDYLVDMVGEIVIAQSLVRHHPDLAAVQNPEVMRNVVQLTRITTEVQKTAMSMRMVPVGGLFQKMARLVRDLCRKSGKQAELVTSGDDTELDRNIVEELADPLMHMVRNAMDHGVEPPQERIAAGKSPVARVELRAMHRAGHIQIEIVDDGRGMNRDAIFAKAVERGIIQPGAVLSDSEVYNLIFEPGFSTAEKVTDISGRGVGMDVVKKHIQKLRGRTEIHTTPGKGTEFQLKLPLTLAIIDGLVVGVGKERYIVPIFAVKELLRPTEGMVGTVEGREIALVRDRVLPVVRLFRRFGVTPRTEDPMDSLLILTESHGVDYCLLVDALVGKQEVVIKSLGDTMKNLPGVAGGAILGDGRIALIVDVDALFYQSKAA